jgi:predicted RND superfamily exporter protein
LKDRFNIFQFISGLSGIRSRKYVGILLCSVAIIAVTGYIALQIRINGDLAVMVPEDSPSVKNLDELEARFGATNTLILLLLAPPGRDISTDMQRVAETLRENPEIKRIDYKMDTVFFEDRGLYYLTVEELEDIRDTIDKRIEHETIKSNPFYVDLDEDEDKEQEKAEPIDSSKVASRFEGADYVKNGYFRKVVDDGKREAWAMIITPARGAADIYYAWSLINDIESRIDALKLGKDFEVLFSGRYYYLAKEGEAVLSDVKKISIIASVCVLAAVLLFFPNIFTIILIFIPLVMGLAIDFAIVKFTIGELNVVTSGNFAILFGMGVAYAVHVYSRFREERKLGHSYEDSMERSVGDTGRAVFISAATTAGAFFILMVAHYKGFSQLGFITGLGVIFTFLTALIVMPAIGKPLSRWNLLRKHGYVGTPTEELIRHWGGGPPAPVTIVAVGTVLSALSLILLFNLDYEMDYNNLTIQDENRERAKQYEQLLFGMSGEPAVTYANGEKELRRLVDHMEKLRAGKGKYHIDKVVSILSFLPGNQEEKRDVIKEIHELVSDKKLNLAEGEERESIDKLRRMSKAEPFGIQDIPPKVRERFEGSNDGYLVYIYPLRDITNLEEAMKVRSLLTNMSVGDRKVSATNTTIVFAEMQDTMLRDTPIVISLAFAVVILCIIFVFRSFTDTFLSLIPLFVGMSWMLGIMVLSDQKINFFSIIAIPAVIGIGVDNGVHIVHRYRVEGLASLKRIVRNLSRTLLVCTVTTIFGFGALLFARHPGIKSLGLAAVSGLITTFLASVLFLPAVIYVHARLSARRLLRRRPKVAVWTMAFDPMTECLKGRLRARKVDFTIVSLDELPENERGMAIRFLREKSGDEGLYFPIIEKQGEVWGAGKMTVAELTRTLDRILP